MFFFSNRFGCLKSLLISLVGTLVLLLVLGVIKLPGGSGSRDRLQHLATKGVRPAQQRVC